MRRPSVIGLLVLVVMLTASGASHAERVLAAVAANFADAAEALQPAFEAETGHSLVFSFGSTGKLYTQIRNGAPFDVFLAADQARPALLEHEGGAVPGSRFTYATGRLTLWSADSDLLSRAAPEMLRTAAIRHLAIANPELSPYGAATRQALERLDLWHTLEARLVVGQDVGASYAKAATGNAQAAFVALSSVLGQGRPTGSRWDVPAELHDPIRQDAVLLTHGAGNPAATAFLAFLRSERARTLIVPFGYSTD
jgi:molybdate transport system substrate-binding protein